MGGAYDENLVVLLQVCGGEAMKCSQKATWQYEMLALYIAQDNTTHGNTKSSHKGTCNTCKDMMDGVLLSTVPLHPLVCVLCGWVGVKGRSVLDGGTLSEWERDTVSGSLPGSSDGIMQWLAAQPASVDCWHTNLSVTYTHTCILRIDHTLCEIQASNLALASLHLYMYICTLWPF